MGRRETARCTVKYMILIYSNPTTWEHPLFFHQEEVLSAEERDAQMNELVRLMTEISESGELLNTHVLANPTLTTTIRGQGESLTSTDGPFAESKEQLAGYIVVDCDTLERAVELAGRFPDARDGAVEVRPIMDPSGMEM